MTGQTPILSAAQNQPIDDMTNPVTRSINPKGTEATLRTVESNVKVKGSIVEPSATSRAFSGLA